MKKLPFLCVLACFVACNENNPDQNNPYANYVDLGLSSGILWSPVNEINSHDSSPYFSHDEMMEVYSGHETFPSTSDWKELWEGCDWIWTGTGYTIVGPGGNSITLPALGFRSNTDGTIHDKDSMCYYWQRDNHNSAMTYYLDKERMWVSSLMSGMPIRLVKKKNRHEAEGSIYEE